MSTSRMTPAVIGLRVHIGYGTAIAVAPSDPPESLPRVVARAKLIMVREMTFEVGAVYHMAAEQPLERAAPMIDEARADAETRARDGLATLVADLATAGFEARAVTLPPAKKPLPPLPKVLAAHPLIHTAEGMLYRGALASAAASLALSIIEVDPRTLPATLAQTLTVTPATLTRDLATIGRAAGRPWAQEQKEPTLAAWLALARAPSR